jgi:hypothetical protein
MNEKEKVIITKLLKIASKQQKVIHKLAQAQPLAQVGFDPNEEYLKNAISAAAANAGVKTPISAFVRSTAGSQNDTTKVEGTYTVMVSGMDQADNNLKQNFMNIYKAQIKSQKPELDGKVSVLFV